MNPIPVLIVAYQNEAAVERCMLSARHWLTGYRIHDNNKHNLGYTRGMNRLLADVVSLDEFPGWSYAVLLNQDAELRPHAILEAALFMDKHPNCAIAGFKQLDPADPDLITHGGTGTPYPAGVHLTGRVSNGDHAVSRKMLWVNGAACIVRLEALKDIGLMDERFFNIGSDSDWCMTAWQKGWEVWYCAEAVALHGRSGCSASPTPEQAEITAKDMAEWGLKWGPTFNPDLPKFHRRAE